MRISDWSSDVCSSDLVVRKNWLEAYDYATDRAAQVLNAFARTDDPFKAVGERTVSVEVTSVVRASDDSFQVKRDPTSVVQGQRVSARVVLDGRRINKNT